MNPNLEIVCAESIEAKHVPIKRFQLIDGLGFMARVRAGASMT
jgi:hypothetical protein